MRDPSPLTDMWMNLRGAVAITLFALVWRLLPDKTDAAAKAGKAFCDAVIEGAQPRWRRVEARSTTRRARP